MATIETRIGKDGRKSYRAKVRRQGAPSEHATFARLTDARRWAGQTEAAIEEGRYFPRSAVVRRTLADVIDRYIRDVFFLPSPGAPGANISSYCGGATGSGLLA